MLLKDYLDSKGIKIVKFASQCGLTYRTLWKYLRGGDIMLSTAKKISMQTDGLVSLEDLCIKSDSVNMR